jgi:GTP cyclohydrolase-4
MQPSIKDIHTLRPIGSSYKLTRVGVKGIKKPILVKRPLKSVTLIASINLFVDLPSSLKGSHLSRSAEVITDVLENAVKKPVSGVEDLCAQICKSLLTKHEYANYAEVNLEADYFLERGWKKDKKSLEPYKLVATAKAQRMDKRISVKKMVGVEVIGLTVCPCAMETLRQQFLDKKILMPVVTHNQRNKSALLIEVPEEYNIEADDLIDIVEGAMSAPTYELLKRGDEASLVYAAHTNPKFVEDVVRDILGKILKKYSDLPDEVQITVRSESEESIHKHNAFAERITTFGDLRKGV